MIISLRQLTDMKLFFPNVLFQVKQKGKTINLIKPQTCQLMEDLS